MASASCAAIDHIDYDGFGNVTAKSAPSLAGDFTWTGLWKQRETEMFHTFWRDYGASWNGWMQDALIHIEGGGDPNIRSNVGKDPVNFIDLSDLKQLPAKPPADIVLSEGSLALGSAWHKQFRFFIGKLKDTIPKINPLKRKEWKESAAT